MENKNSFEQLSKIDVSEYIEKKGRFSYLSWAWAVTKLRETCPDAIWEVQEYGENHQPYVKTEAGCFVKVTVTINGISLSQTHPVLDNMNKTIENPNAFQINTSIQRCLAKAIALHGLGLNIYAGEDLPEVNGVEPFNINSSKNPKQTSGGSSIVSQQICPECGGKLLKSKYGDGFYCSNYKEKNCKFKLQAPEKELIPKEVINNNQETSAINDDVPF